jgi:lysophospholipase L1-like esterase
MTKKHIYVLWASLLISFCIHSQDTLGFNTPRIYGFENLQSDTISNGKLIISFIEKLQLQKQNNDRKINILHIGDSHLQADYITHTSRVSLQKIFGNAGRGFIAPLKISKSNEPFNYQTTSNNTWKSSRCVSSKQLQTIGLGGMSIKTNDRYSTMQLKTYNTDSMDYAFKKIKLYHATNDSSFSVHISDTSTKNSFSQTKSDLPYTTNFTASIKTSLINVYFQKTDSIQSNFVFYGAAFENEKNGVLYHCIGINGARYKDYSKSNEFCSQTASLNPDILIISLGTNESFQKKYNSEIFYQEIDTLVTNLKKANPNTPILLTTPANSFYYHQINYNLPLVSQTIIKYATDNNLAYWDLFSITGGQDSAILWKKANLLSRDGIHYSKDGYIHQGNLLTKAIINAYNKYVSTR